MAWRTEDYIDLLTPFQAGFGMGQANRSRRMQEESQRMREAQVANELGVEPVRDASGKIDWGLTSQLARVQREQDATAAEIGLRHGLGVAGPPTESEASLMNTPAYKRSLMQAELAKFNRDMQAEAALRQIEAQGAWRKDIAEQAAADREAGRKESEALRRALASTETITVENPDGTKSVIRRPISADGSRSVSKTEDPRIQKLRKAIDNVRVAEALGKAIDVGEDSSGLPTVKADTMWSLADAKPSKPESYRAQIDKFLKQIRMIEGALGTTPETKGTEPGLTHDASGRRIR